MIRGLLGIPKLDFDQQVRDHDTELRWRRVHHFINEHLRYLDVPQDKAPQFVQGLETMDDFERAPDKLLSFLARGRQYKGRLEALLEDTQPELVHLYRGVLEDPPFLDLLRSYVTKVHVDNDVLPEVIRCIDIEFPPDSSKNDENDNGIASGKRGEANLESFLRDHELTVDLDCFLATNVLVKAKGKTGNNKESKIVLEISLPQLPSGMTNEFDAIVMRNVGDEVQLVAVWEAKATLHPITIRDALSKKRNAIEMVVQDTESKVYINADEKSYPIMDSMPLFGLFGNSLLSPTSAGYRVQAASCEERLETDPEAVQEVLGCGYVVPGNVQPKLQDTLELATTTECCMVVASELDERINAS